jgi:hypothetical protein
MGWISAILGGIFKSFLSWLQARWDREKREEAESLAARSEAMRESIKRCDEREKRIEAAFYTVGDDDD